MAIGREYELDVLRTFVKRKASQRWIVYAIRKANNDVVNFSVGCRTHKTLKQVTDTLVLSCARRVLTDKIPPP